MGLTAIDARLGTSIFEISLCQCLLYPLGPIPNSCAMDLAGVLFCLPKKSGAADVVVVTGIQKAARQPQPNP